MPDFITSAKSVCEWRLDDLIKARVVKTRCTSPEDFFGIEQLPAVEFFDPRCRAFFEIEGTNVDVENSNCPGEVMRILDTIHAIHVDPGDNVAAAEAALTAKLVNKLLEMMDFDSPGLAIRPQISMHLRMGRSVVTATPDFVIIDQAFQSHLLTVIVDETDRKLDPFAQLFAGMIASVQHNNYLRDVMSDADGHRVVLMPGIIVYKSFPKFYLAHITSEVVDAISEGRPPNVTTIVKCFSPSIPAQLRLQGLMLRENREPILACFEAFKNFIPKAATDIPPGWRRTLSPIDLAQIETDVAEISASTQPTPMFYLHDASDPAGSGLPQGHQSTDETFLDTSNSISI